MRVNVLNGRRIVGAKLARARVNKGLSQKQLAAMIGRTEDTIYSLEHDRRNTSPETLDAICKALGCTKRLITELVPEQL